jgi:hypothetical protein
MPYRHLLRVAAALIGAILLFMLTLWLLAWAYEDELQDVVRYELNRYMEVPIQTGRMELSLLKRFPKASIHLHHVVIPMTSRPDDTLAYASDLYFTIGLVDFLRKRYHIHEAGVKQGFVHMELYTNGTDNYHFWKTPTDSSGPVTISLTNFRLQAMDYSLRLAGGEVLSLSANEASASGSFGESNFDLKANLAATQIRYETDGNRWLQLPQLDVQTSLSANGNALELHATKLRIGDENLSGRMQYEGAGQWNAQLSTTAARLENLIAMAPSSVQQALAAYQMNGKTDLVLNLDARKGENLRTDVVVDRLKATLNHSEAPSKARIAHAKGSLQVRNGATSIYIDKLSGSIGPGNIVASGKIINLSAPSFDLLLRGSVALEELHGLMQIQTVEVLEGKLHMDGRLTGEVKPGKTSQTTALLKGLHFDGKIELNNGGLLMRNSDYRFDRVSGILALHDNALEIQKAEARINGNPFTFTGKISNALPYLTQGGQRLHVAAQFAAKHVDLNEVLAENAGKRDTTYKLELPTHISFDLGVQVEKAMFRKFTATQIVGTLHYHNGLLTLNPMQFRTAGGEVRSSLSLQDTGKGTYIAAVRAALNHMEVSALFEQFENFGQEVIQARHLSGSADAYIDLQCQLNNTLHIDTKSIAAKTDVTIARGKLKNLETLQGIPNYLRQNTLWKTLVKVNEFEKKLREITFDTLRNTIEIKNSLVSIPAMTIRSTAMDIHLSGKHHFDNRIDYAINFKLGDLLRTGKRNQDEFGYITDDASGLRLFMRMTGTVENPIFSLDKDGARNKRKQEYEREKNTVKSILKQEFGLFRSDTTLTGVPPTTKNRVQITIEGQHDENKSAPKTDQKQPAKQDPKKPKPSKKDQDFYDKLEKDEDL